MTVQSDVFLSYTQYFWHNKLLIKNMISCYALSVTEAHLDVVLYRIFSLLSYRTIWSVSWRTVLSFSASETAGYPCPRPEVPILQWETTTLFMSLKFCWAGYYYIDFKMLKKCFIISERWRMFQSYQRRESPNKDLHSALRPEPFNYWRVVRAGADLNVEKPYCYRFDPSHLWHYRHWWRHLKYPPPQLSCQKIYGSLKNYVHKLSGVSIIGTPLAKDGQQGSTTLTKLLLSHVSRLNSFSAIFTNSCSLFHENSALGHGELPCARPYCPGQINFLLLIRTLCGPFPSSPWPIWPLPLHV